jgi:hypothetical protein
MSPVVSRNRHCGKAGIVGIVAQLRVGLYIVPEKPWAEIAMKCFLLVATLLGLCVSIAFGQWQAQTVGTKSEFRGLGVVSPNVVWVSGTTGTYARTTDGGKTWSVGSVPGAEKLDFRDIEAFGETMTPFGEWTQWR